MKFRKSYIILIIILFLGIALFWNFRMKTYKNEEYNFSFKYRATFVEKYNKDLLVFLKDNISGIEISATARRTTGELKKTFTELGEGFANLIKIYKDNYDVTLQENETILIWDDVWIQKVTVDMMTNDNEQIREIAVMIPLDDREITIIFFGMKEQIIEKEYEIEKVIKSIKIY